MADEYIALYRRILRIAAPVVEELA